MKKRYFKKYRREGKTNYRVRLNLLKSGTPRFVIRIKNKNIVMQIVKYMVTGDQIVFSAVSTELTKKGWKGSRTNLPSAYLLAYLLAKKASGKIKEVILDIGDMRSIAHSRAYAAVKGLVDGGVKINVNDEILPTIERIRGEHIKAYAELLLKENKQKYEKQFSLYLKKKFKPEELPHHFEEIKAKI